MTVHLIDLVASDKHEETEWKKNQEILEKLLLLSQQLTLSLEEQAFNDCNWCEMMD